MSERLSFEDYLEKNEKLIYSNVGTSMMPLLRQGKDLFVITKRGSERFKAGDVVLYRRPPDSYVLHRIIKVRKNDYVIIGDNCIRKEYGIKDKDILGSMTGYVRNGREHSISEKGYRAYSWVMLYLCEPRIFLKKCEVKMKGIIKKIWLKTTTR